MPSPAGGQAAAETPTVEVDEYVPTAAELAAQLAADEARRVRRLHSAVEQRRRALDELADAEARVEKKYAKYERLLKGKAAELREAKAMIVAAERALREAETEAKGAA